MPDTLRAAIWTIGAVVSFTSMALAGRSVGTELDTFEIMLYRSLIGIIVVTGTAWAFGTLHQINRQQMGLHGVRNLAHFTGQNLWFYALTMIPLAQVVALEFTSPFWIILLSPFLLGERMTPTGAFAAAFAFAGVILIIKPGVIELSPGTVAAGTAAIGFALTSMLTRKLTRTQTLTCIMFWLTIMQAVFGLIGAGYDGVITPPARHILPFVVIIGLSGLLAHVCLTKALSLAPATLVMPIDYVRLPVAAVLGWYLYSEAIDLWMALGIFMVFAGNILNLTFGQARGGKTAKTIK